MHFRDPKVWYEAGYWWMVVGARDTEQQGQVLLYKGESLTDWLFDRVLAQAKPGEGYMWECPDFFKLGDYHYLMCSPQGVAPQGDRFANLFQSGILAGDWSPGENFTVRQAFKELDHGHDFYAPQSFLAADGRRIIFAWMDMWESTMPTKLEGWCGSFTLPRELFVQQGQLCQRPVRELQALRGEEIRVERLRVGDDYLVNPHANRAELHLKWDLLHNNVAQLGLKIGANLQLSYDLADQRLSLTRRHPQTGTEDIRRVEIDPRSAQEWQIFIDSSSIEIFINGGTAVLTSRFYPTNEDYQLRLFSCGAESELAELRYWPLRSAIE